MTWHESLQHHASPGVAASGAAFASGAQPRHWSFDTMLDVVRWRAARQPNELAYTFLLDPGAIGQGDAEQTGETAQFTYAQLDRRARAIAAHLQQHGAGSRGLVGQRALVVLEPGLDYIAALFGCFYAGVVPAPVYPPDPFRIARTLPRLQAIFSSAECQYLISSGAILGSEESTLRQTCPRGAIEIETIPDAAADNWREVQSDPSRLALLQYTSGTTGEPRGVPITHANLVANLRGMEQALDVDDAVAMFWLPPYHDLGLIGGVFLPLFASRHTVLMSPLDFMRSPASWLRAISHFGATTSAAPNFGYELCVRKIKESDCVGLDLSNWQVAVSGAEPVRAETLDRFCQRFAPYGFRREALVPAYGMAETTLMVSVGALGKRPQELEVDADALAQSEVKLKPGGRRIVGCGPAGPDVEIQIVNPDTCQPTRGVGEVWVRGPSVASGYWRHPELSAEQFGQTLEPSPTTPAHEQADGSFRTGDLGFERHGELFLVGRRKEMIILAGRNYYPQDIELAVQSAHPALKPDGGAAISVEQDAGERLVLLQEVQRPRKQDLDELLEVARRACMEETGQTPFKIVLLPVGELPKTSSGKTRRADCWQALAAGELTVLAEWPAGDAAPSAPPFQPPTGATETWLALAWGEILHLDQVGREDNFFALGGRSLQVTQMLTQVAEQTGMVLPLRTLFDHPTLAQLADHIDQQQQKSPPSQASQPTDRTSFDLSQPQPLSPAQQRFWMIEQVGVPGGANVPLAMRLSGTIPPAQLKDALSQLIARHDALRTRFTAHGAVVTQQAVASAAMKVERWRLDAAEFDDAELSDETLLERVLEQPWVWRPFDLAAPPLMRAAIVDTPRGDQVLLLVLHHLIADGSSIGLLVDELARLTNQQPLPSDAPSYVDYLTAPPKSAEADARYWSERLAGVPPTLDLPLETPIDRSADEAPNGQLSRPANVDDAPHRVAITSRTIDRAVCRQIEQTAAELVATPFLVLLSAYQLVLGRYTGQTNIGVGAAVARRGAGHEGVVGCLINSVPLFAEIDPASNYTTFLRQLRDAVLEDLDHAGLPWEAIVEASGKPRVPGRMPLVQAFFIHDDAPPNGQTLGGAEIIDTATDYRGLGLFDLSLVVETHRSQPRLKLIHDHQRFPASLAERLLASLDAVLRAIVAGGQLKLAKLPVPSEGETQTLQLGGEPRHYAYSGNGSANGCSNGLLNGSANGLAVDRPTNVAQQIARQAHKSPDELAIVCGYETRTFAQLVDRSRRVAARLQAAGVRPGDRVGLLLERTVDLPAVMLGVWQAGAAYVPLDPAYPAERLELMACDAQLVCLVLNRSLANRAPRCDAQTVVVEDLLSSKGTLDPGALPAMESLSGESLAYIMYTSGSTGRPKGVMVSHGAVANLLDSFAQDTKLAAGNAMLAATTISFDISVLELFLPLVTGARLVLANSQTAGDANRLAALLAMTDVTHVQGAPSMLRMLLSAGWRPRSSQTILSGGEELPPDLARELAKTASEVWNVYGPTETTIWSTLAVLDSPCAAVPIGRPIAGTRCYILDDSLQLAPLGAWGQLAIAGAGVAEGYWNLPQLTAERFPSDPFAEGNASARMYLTGDTARWNANGALEFGGRVDGQVKVRGHRIELREVELALTAHPAVHEAAVIAVDQSELGAALLAYVAPVAGGEWSPAVLLQHLASRLPAYMAPSAFVELAALPRTANGKIDRNALPRDASAARSSHLVEPRTPLERRLADWVRELLRIDRVGVFDNFFELGGQSLLATQLVVRMRDELGVEPPLRDVYEQPTIAQWAELVLRCELQAKDNLASDLLDQLDEMTDQQAAELLKSLGGD